MSTHKTAVEPMPSDTPHAVVNVLHRIIDDLDETYLDLPVGLLLCDSDRGLRYAARSFLNLLGMSLQEASGFGWLERFTPSSLRNFDRWRKSSDEQSDWEQELQIEDGRGSLRTLLLHAQAIEETATNSKTWAIVYLDITDRRQSLQADKYARDFAEAVIRTLPYPIAVLHSSHRIIAANTEFYRLFNSNRVAIDGEILHQLLLSNDTELTTLIDGALRNGQAFDHYAIQTDQPATNFVPLSISGRRLMVPDHDEAMVLVTFTRRETVNRFIKLPLAAPVGESNGEDVSAKYRVLVVDDSESDAFLLTELLSVMGHTVAMAHNGRDALTQVNTFAPQMIIADISTAEFDGNEWAKRLQTRSDRQRILLAALAHDGQETDGDGLVEAGFDAYLTKPVEITELQTLFELLSARRRDPS